MSRSTPSPQTGTSQTPFRVFADEVAGADIAGQRGDPREEARAPQNRVAALAAVRRHDYGAAFAGVEGGDEAVDIGRRDIRHVAEAHQRAIVFAVLATFGCGQGGEPRRKLALRPSA